MKIYKYTLPCVPCVCKVSMPLPVKYLSVGAQGEDVCVWVIVRPEEEPVEVEFAVVWTGGEIPTGFFSHYIGTAQVQDQGGELVCHVFAR